MMGADVAASSSNTPIFEKGSSPLRFGHVLSNNSPGQLVDGAIGSVVLLNSTADEDDLLAIHQAFYGDTV